MNKKADIVLEFIKRFFIENGQVPTIREIGEGIGSTSTGYVWTLLEILKERGDIIQRGKNYTVKGVKISFDDMQQM